MDNQYSQWQANGQHVVNSDGTLLIAACVELAQAEWVAQRLNYAANAEVRLEQIGAARPAGETP